MNKKFKHTATFKDLIVKASVHTDVDKYLSLASLDALKKIDIPESINLDKNVDLILAVYNGAVINRLNKNGDGMATETALKIKDLFLHKPTNLEHKKGRVVGHIVNVGWSRFGSNELLTDEQVAEMTEPFNLVVASVIYRFNEEKFSDMLIDSSDETSSMYNSISASWEIGFDDYVIALGSKNLNEAEIVSDPEQVKELSKYLKAYGGTGETPDGKIVGRVVIGEAGEALPLGFGFTNKPAAEVQGVTLLDFSDISDENNEEESKSEIYIKENQENISISSKSTVINNSNKTMKIKNIEDVLALIPENNSEAKESVSDYIKTGLEAAAKEWENKASAKERELLEQKELNETLKNNVEASTEQLKDITTKYEELIKKVEAQAKEAAFSQRMEALEKEFSLSSKDREIIAKTIRSLSEESYAEWYEQFSVLSNEKKLDVIAAREAELEDKINNVKKEKSSASEAVDNLNSEEVLDEVKEREGQSIANTQAPEEGLSSKYEDAFKDCVKIKY